MKNIIDSLNWRYAAKVFDPDKKISDETFNDFLEAVRLSPSSFGLQPWKFIVVKNTDVRSKIKEAAYGQAQVVDASHLIVFAVDKNFSVGNYIKSVATVRGVPAESLDDYKGMIDGFLAPLSPDEKTEWATKQVYLALGITLVSAAAMEIDSCPMEGFDGKVVDEILGLKTLGLESRVLLPVGYRSSNDKYASLPKARYSKEEVVIELK